MYPRISQMTIISTVPLHFQFNMSPSSSSMPGYPYGSSGSYAGAMYAAATSTTKEPASLMGDSINSLRLKAKQHSSSSSPTGAIASTTSYYPASVSPGKSNSSESPNLTLNPDLFSSSGGATSNNNSGTASNSVVTSESVWENKFEQVWIVRISSF